MVERQFCSPKANTVPLGTGKEARVFKHVRLHTLYEQAKEQLKDIDWKQYDDIMFVSKSIGTIVSSAYAVAYSLQVKHVLYTPLKYTFQYNPKNAIAFIGTKDAWSDYKEVVSLSQKANIPIKVYDGCNHSLEVEDDVEGNIHRLKEIMDMTARFLNEMECNQK